MSLDAGKAIEGRACRLSMKILLDLARALAE
jgi:hypothetical protein